MGSADLHIHTALGDGLAELPALLAHVQEHTDLDVIAVTEHDQVEAALALRELHARDSYRFDVVVGAEITTLEGHLLALYVEEPIPSLRPLAKTIDLIHRQGGLCVVPHPMSPLTRSIGRRGLERIARRRSDGLWFDGIELANPSPAGRISAVRARALNETLLRLPEVGGSDAHFLPAVGCAQTLFPGSSAADLYAAIRNGTTSSRLGTAPRLREIGAGALALQSWRALWATPKRVVRGPWHRVAAGAGLRPARTNGPTPTNGTRPGAPGRSPEQRGLGGHMGSRSSGGTGRGSPDQRGLGNRPGEVSTGVPGRSPVRRGLGNRPGSPNQQ